MATPLLERAAPQKGQGRSRLPLARSLNSEEAVRLTLNSEEAVREKVCRGSFGSIIIVFEVSKTGVPARPITAGVTKTSVSGGRQWLPPL